jgi:hypothetical protein
LPLQEKGGGFLTRHYVIHKMLIISILWFEVVEVAGVETALAPDK